MHRTIPSSYFRSSKPAYFGYLAWPPFDPASPPGAFNDSNLCRIPAGYRFVHGADLPTAVRTSAIGLPTQTKLDQNYPNPFNPSTIIRFALAEGSFISLKVFDILGREVSTLATGWYLPGYHNIQWNAAGLASGVYLCRLSVASPGIGAKPIPIGTRALLLVK